MRKIIIYIIKLLLHFFWIFPIKKNRVFFIAYDGKQFSCNPKYISMYLDSIKFQKIWFLKNKNILLDDAIVIRKKNIRYYYYLLTSKFIINNINMSSIIPKRRNQILINTWHGGGAYKYSGSLVKDKSELKKIYSINDVFLSSSSLFTEKVIVDTFGFEKLILNTGLPRNDLLFLNDNYKNKIFEFLNIEHGDYCLVLYAPTFRDSNMNYNYDSIDYNLLQSTFEKIYEKKCIILNRFHHNTPNNNDFCYNVTNYPDMQELLLSVDVLITDYSSCLWDYAITNKPAFIYAPDLEEYIEKRSFYVNIYDWGFPVSRTNSELIDMINNFKYEEFVYKINEMKKRWGSYEEGNACYKVVKFIEEKM